MKKSVTTRNQRRVFKKELGDGTYVVATVRWDDQCGNGRNELAVTGNIWDGPDGAKRAARGKECDRGGCVHEETLEAFPELKEAVELHLCSADGPPHYVENTVYLAGNRDYNGLRAGEFRQLRNSEGLLRWHTKHRIEGSYVTVYAAERPEPYTEPDGTVIPFVADGIFGKGKGREFDSARRVACWPDATDEQLSLPAEELTALLNARLPDVLARLHACVTGLGFVW